MNKDKVFTLEDMKKSCSLIFLALGDGGDITTDEVLQSLQQPTEIEVEIEMEQYLEDNLSHIQGELPYFKLKPKLDENGCIILKKK